MLRTRSVPEASTKQYFAYIMKANRTQPWIFAFAFHADHYEYWKCRKTNKKLNRVVHHHHHLHCTTRDIDSPEYTFMNSTFELGYLKKKHT